jgi:hypothetical protein
MVLLESAAAQREHVYSLAGHAGNLTEVLDDP